VSYNVELQDPVTRNVLEVEKPHYMKGDKYDPEGSTRLELGVTWNYSGHICRVFGTVMQGIHSLSSLYGMTGAESIPVLKAAIALLGDEVNEDYWQATEGNVKQALNHLLAMAQMRPDGVWRVI